MNKKVTPVGTNLTIKTELESADKGGGIVIPDFARKKTNTATVVEVGDMVEEVKAGDRVLYNIGSGTDIGDLSIISEKDCIAVL